MRVHAISLIVALLLSSSLCFSSSSFTLSLDSFTFSFAVHNTTESSVSNTPTPSPSISKTPVFPPSASNNPPSSSSQSETTIDSTDSTESTESTEPTAHDDDDGTKKNIKADSTPTPVRPWGATSTDNIVHRVAMAALPAEYNICLNMSQITVAPHTLDQCTQFMGYILESRASDQYDLSQLNKIKNPSFNSNSISKTRFWDPVETGFMPDVISQDPPSTITNSIMLVTSNIDEYTYTVQGARQMVDLNNATYAALYVGVWSKAYKLTGIQDDNFGVYLDIVYKDGTFLYGQVLSCPVSSSNSDWVYSDTIFRLSNKEVHYVNVTLLLREHTGAVWFDNLYLIPITDVNPSTVNSPQNFHVGIFGAARVWALDASEVSIIAEAGNHKLLYKSVGDEISIYGNVTSLEKALLLTGLELQFGPGEESKFQIGFAKDRSLGNVDTSDPVLFATLGEDDVKFKSVSLTFGESGEVTVLLSWNTDNHQYQIMTFSVVKTGSAPSSLEIVVNVRKLLANSSPTAGQISKPIGQYFEVIFSGTGEALKPNLGAIAGESAGVDLFNPEEYSVYCDYWSAVVCDREALTFLNHSCTEDYMKLSNPFIVQNYHWVESHLHLTKEPLLLEVGAGEVYDRPVGESDPVTSYSGFTLTLIGAGGVLLVILSVALIFRLRKKRTGQKVTVLHRPSQQEEEPAELEMDDILRYEDEHDD